MSVVRIILPYDMPHFLSMPLFARLSVFLSACLPACLPVCLSISLSLLVSPRLSTTKVIRDNLKSVVVVVV